MRTQAAPPHLFRGELFRLGDVVHKNVRVLFAVRRQRRVSTDEALRVEHAFPVAAARRGRKEMGAHTSTAVHEHQ